MNIQLTHEQSVALNSAEHRLTVVDPSTNRKYVIVDADDFECLTTLNAIRTGLSQMESGEGQPLADAMNDVREFLKQRT